MNCSNHPETESAALCSGCQEPFCGDCLVEIHDQPYCKECKIMAIERPPLPPDEGTIACEPANQSLLYAIIGIFCFGFILGPIAMAKGFEARKLIASDPTLAGRGKSTAGIVLGALVAVFSVINVIARVMGMAAS